MWRPWQMQCAMIEKWLHVGSWYPNSSCLVGCHSSIHRWWHQGESLMLFCVAKTVMKRRPNLICMCYHLCGKWIFGLGHLLEQQAAEGSSWWAHSWLKSNHVAHWSKQQLPVTCDVQRIIVKHLTETWHIMVVNRRAYWGITQSLAVLIV
jgi:hypothetical protein